MKILGSVFLMLLFGLLNLSPNLSIASENLESSPPPEEVTENADNKNTSESESQNSPPQPPSPPPSESSEEKTATPDETSSKQQLIRQLLSLTKANDPQTIADQFSAFASAQLEPLAQQFADGQATLKKSLAQAAQKFSSAIIPKIENIYINAFSSYSIQDLQTIVNFYSSEAGQKFNDTLFSISPQLVSASADPSVIKSLTQEIMQAFTLPSSSPTSFSPSPQEATAAPPENTIAPSAPPTPASEKESAPDQKTDPPAEAPSQDNP